jgi:hypothetical protein
LSELVDAALQKLLIGPQISQLVGAGRWKTRQQCDRRGHAANRRQGADSTRFRHR